MIEKPDREKMREKAQVAFDRHPDLKTGDKISEQLQRYMNSMPPSVCLQLLDQIDELEARLATEREAGYREAISLLQSSKAREYSSSCKSLSGLPPIGYDYGMWLETFLDRMKPKPGQTVCAHGNQEPMPEEFEKVFKENWKDILA